MDALTREYRAQNLALRAHTIRDLQRLWPALRYDDLERTFPAWLAGAVALIGRDRTRAAGLASLYLKAHRLAAGVPGEPAVRLAATLPAEQIATSLRVTTVVAIKKATMAGQGAELAMRNAFVQSTGSATRLALNGGRDTIRETTAHDPRTAGWQRVTSGGCDFCEMLAGRGDVYTEASADFDAHDWCMCSAEPVYDAADRNAPSEWRPAKARGSVPEQTDRDANRTTEELRATLAQLEKSLAKFDSPGTRARVEELRRKIAARR